MKLKLSDMLYMAQEGDNILISKWLEDLEELINDTPNSFELGEKIRKICN